MSSPSGVSAEDYFWCLLLLWSVLHETQRAVQCDSEIDMVWILVKLQTIPCNIEFAFRISVP